MHTCTDCNHRPLTDPSAATSPPQPCFIHATHANLPAHSSLPPARLRHLLPASNCRTCREVVDPAASYYGHLLSSGSMHDLANSTVTVVAGVVPTAAQAQQLASRAAASAHASSMVDPAAAAAEASSYGGAASVLEVCLGWGLRRLVGAEGSLCGLKSVRCTHLCCTQACFAPTQHPKILVMHPPLYASCHSSGVVC
jgi:hypothetical protein